MAQKMWLPQDVALVRFADDPSLLHWRCVLHCSEGDEVTVVAPDRDVENTTLVVGSKYTEIKRMFGNRLPSRVREDDTYLPRHSDQGDFDHEELRKLVLSAEKQHAGPVARTRIIGKGNRPEVRLEPPEPEVVRWCGWWFTVLAVVV